MSHLPVDHSPTPIRLFKSDFLEFFTHISPVTVVVIWLPVALFFIARSISTWAGPGFPLYIPIALLVGVFLWTFAEYTLHRFVFHFRARTPWQERVTFLFHGIHHAQPQCKTRLVMPPAVSIPMAFIFYGLFYGLVGVGLAPPAVGRSVVRRFYDWLLDLRPDPLCHPPFSDALGGSKILEALPHAASL